MKNKRIDNPWIRVVKCVDALKMKTSVESLQKQTVGLIFNLKNSHSYWIGPYRQKKSFRYTDRGRSSSRWFSFESKSSSSSFVSACTAFVHWNLSPRSVLWKIVLIMVPWPKIDALRKFIFCEVSIVGKTPLGRKLQPPHLCGLKTMKSWIFHFSKQKRSTTGQVIWTLFS